ncbi:hypothetical protein FB45DRAFT_937912 [Roridomyces roridus]|uniref:NADAR domain-containing protein n=1 Tax=Roridomyces roridus TaxID=1738132 RepID=A0AAD7B9P3_9AGAR|nr:hypothetical protein FB45DRAFT_937912 [Roridomyces roridus]
MRYRIDQHRTVYITTDIPPPQWDAAQLNHFLDHGEKKASEPKIDGGNRASTAFPQWPSSPARHSKGNSFRPTRRARILFYHKTDPHYGFTNFSPHPVHYDNKMYPTSEHLFQSFKFEQHRPDIAEHIRTCSHRATVALAQARRYQSDVRPDWKNINVEVMDLVLWQKFTQHPSLKQELLATGDAELVENSDKDSFWGIGANKQGQNELGKALERVRAKLRHSP